jgi:hypothetical protein
MHMSSTYYFLLFFVFFSVYRVEWYVQEYSIGHHCQLVHGPSLVDMALRVEWHSATVFQLCPNHWARSMHQQA